MPATVRGNSGRRFAIGVDGCRIGWVCARINLNTGAADALAAPRFASLMSLIEPNAALIFVDMPIGLPERGRRAAERQARAYLSPRRHASVFSPPRRPMLAFDDYAAANAFGKAIGDGGISKQAWMIAPKIREVDAWMTPEKQHRVMEAHPEVAFARLNANQPCQHPKRTSAGAEERRALLRAHGIENADALYRALRSEFGAGIGRDDLFDAAVLAIAARDTVNGRGIRFGGNERDKRGLLMEIRG